MKTLSAFLSAFFPGRLALLGIAFGLLVVAPIGCKYQRTEDPEGSDDEASEEVEGETTTVGPVSATVSVSPRNPTLGDSIQLRLRVTAEADVDVTMPAFGEQLGRFQIVDYTPRESHTASGGSTFEQRYTLDLPMSGKHRVPALLVEFVDNRQAGDGELHELLTEEVVVVVASVLPDGELATELRPLRDPLEPIEDPDITRSESLVWPWVLGGVVLLGLIALMVWRFGFRRSPLSSHALALRRLNALEHEGMPSGSLIDGWYVRLSDIVRHYLEGRYRLRAPELTTEEFLSVAGASVLLRDDHRRLLRELLQHADHVKFAAYVPDAAESRSALDAAFRFVEESRPTEKGEDT